MEENLEDKDASICQPVEAVCHDSLIAYIVKSIDDVQDVTPLVCREHPFRIPVVESSTNYTLPTAAVFVVAERDTD
uniref:Uncharacterized protein n=1 Tax=Oryza glumipatula TaxID=40148 RepID=A0A0E0AAN1_9ORYZ